MATLVVTVAAADGTSTQYEITVPIDRPLYPGPATYPGSATFPDHS